MVTRQLPRFTLEKVEELNPAIKWVRGPGKHTFSDKNLPNLSQRIAVVLSYDNGLRKSLEKQKSKSQYEVV